MPKPRSSPLAYLLSPNVVANAWVVYERFRLPA